MTACHSQSCGYQHVAISTTQQQSTTSCATGVWITNDKIMTNINIPCAEHIQTGPISCHSILWCRQFSTINAHSTTVDLHETFKLSSTENNLAYSRKISCGTKTVISMWPALLMTCCSSCTGRCWTPPTAESCHCVTSFF